MSFAIPTSTYIIIGASLVFSFVIFAVARGYMKKMMGGNLKNTGEPAQAKILRMWDTGTTINQHPVAGFLLEVQRMNQTPYQVETKSLVPRLMSGQLQPGAVVPIKVDPSNPTKVALDIFG
jgi:hypothetical protein